MSELYVIEYVVYWVLPTYKCVTVVRVIECYLPTNVSLLLVIEWVRCYSVLPTYKRVTVIGVSECYLPTNVSLLLELVSGLNGWTRHSSSSSLTSSFQHMLHL